MQNIYVVGMTNHTVDEFNILAAFNTRCEMLQYMYNRAMSEDGDISWEHFEDGFVLCIPDYDLEYAYPLIWKKVPLR